MRFGLIGYGAIGAVRASALRRTPGATLSMIAEVSPERRAQASRENGVAATASMEELVGSREVDAVVVSTPPHVHRRHCEAALAAGKHVLCEKPLATTPEDCHAIVDAAARGGRTLATGFNYRFYPAVAKAREVVQSGRVGEVTHVVAYAGHPGGPEFTHPWVHDPSIMGGGALMDNGIHAADLLLHFLGPVSECSGMTSDATWHFGASEDNGFVLARTAEGRIGTLHASWTQWRGYRFHVDVYGTKGSVRVWYPPMLTIVHDAPAGHAKKGRRKIHWFPAFQVKERLRSYRWTIVQSFVAEHLDFLARVSGQPGVGATGVDGSRAVELAQSAYARSTSRPQEATMHLERLQDITR